MNIPIDILILPFMKYYYNIFNNQLYCLISSIFKNALYEGHAIVVNLGNISTGVAHCAMINDFFMNPKSNQYEYKIPTGLNIRFLLSAQIFIRSVLANFKKFTSFSYLRNVLSSIF